MLCAVMAMVEGRGRERGSGVLMLWCWDDNVMMKKMMKMMMKMMMGMFWFRAALTENVVIPVCFIWV
jgi:hypothetical protein